MIRQEQEQKEIEIYFIQATISLVYYLINQMSKKEARRKKNVLFEK